MGKVCVCGADEVIVDYNNRTVTVGGMTFNEGDYMSIDGTSGLVYAGKVETSPSEIIQVLISKTMKPEDSRTYQNFARLMQWCDDCTKMKVRTNADSPKQTETAIAFGATGIGLCRTEHMFFEGDRIDFVREMILSTKKSDRVAAVSKLLPYQKGDFKGIFKALKGLPGTIRLLDPPLHEFLPQTKEQQLDLAQKICMPVEVIMRRVAELHEFNPMLGHRGCRLGIAYPEITEMQARAIFEAAVEVSQEEGFAVVPEIMVPLVAFKKELDIQKAIIDKVAKQVFEEKGAKVDYLVGTMIEIPRAAVTADEIAETAQFFSFGTNDLTQTGLGMSRDDSGSFLPQYQELEIIKKNVFASIDQEGVGKLMKIAVELGRSTRPDIKLGICGEHGGDPASVKFCNTLGLTYVSCSPYRVPTARLAAAQAALEQA
jgi:pyruvate,orthophosphate dikinase